MIIILLLAELHRMHFKIQQTCATSQRLVCLELSYQLLHLFSLYIKPHRLPISFVRLFLNSSLFPPLLIERDRDFKNVPQKTNNGGSVTAWCDVNNNHPSMWHSDPTRSDPFWKMRVEHVC